VRRALAVAAAFALALVALVAVACASPAGAPESPPAMIAASPGPGGTTTATATPTVTATPTTTATPTPAVSLRAAVPDGASVTVSAVGDISLAREVVDRMRQQGAAYPFALVAPLIDGDIGFGNLEGALTEQGEPWPKGYNFRTPPQFASALTAGRIGVVTLANNHTMDYGVVGLEDTLAALDAAGVRHAGAGADEAAARAPAVVEVRGLRVAFLGYVLTPDEFGGFSIRAWAAGPGAPGVAIGSAEAIAADVAAAKQAADFVIVAVHAGDEYQPTPNATQRALAQAALDAGADAFIGAHAHVVQPVEQRGQQLVAWGLGNFVFDLDPVDLANIPEPRVSLVLRITLTKGAGVTAWEAIPVTLDDTQDRPRPAIAEEGAVLRRMIAAP